MLHTKSQGQPHSGFGEDFLKGFYHLWANLVMWPEQFI